MELSLGPSFEDIAAGGVELAVELAEVVVYGCCPEHAHPLSFMFVYFKHLCLNNHAQAFYEEDAA